MGRKRRRKLKQFNFRINPKIGWWSSLIFCCLVLLFGLGYAIYTADVFKIKEADIRSDIPLDRGLIEKIKEESLFGLDIESIASRLIKAHPEYKEIYVYREFPSSLVVESVKRIPFAQIKGRRYYPVDREAVITGEGQTEPLDGLVPLEIGAYRYGFSKGGNIDSEELEYAFNLVGALGDAGFLNGNSRIKLINSSRLEAIYFIFSESGSREQDWPLGQGIKVIVGKGDFRRKLKLFRNLLDQELKDKISSVNYIDLRFKRVYMDFKR